MVCVQSVPYGLFCGLYYSLKLKMPPEPNKLVDTAFLLDLEIKQHVKLIRDNFWNFVGLLERARENKIWLQLDYDTYASWLAQPEIDLNEHTVENYISIYRSISSAMKNSDMSELPNVSIDIKKLEMIAPVVNKDNISEWLSKADTLSRSDLRKEINEQKYGTSPVVIPAGKFNVIYADPPWSYGDKHDYNGTTGAETHYPSMSIYDLCQMVIPSSDNAVLFMWVTSPLLDECWPVIKAWGFDYKTSFVWDKVKHNMGHYNSVRHELLLICTKGSMTPEVPKLYDSVVTEERSEVHSQKPNIFYEIIETLYPTGKYLELFARNKRDRWTSYGNQL